MTGRRRAIFLSSVRWDHTWQRHHSLARAAAEDGWSVDFVEPHPRSLRHIASHVVRRARGSTGERVRQPVPPGVRVCADWWRRPSLIRQIRASRFDLCLLTLPSRPFLGLASHLRCDVRVYDRLVDWGMAPQEWTPRGWAAVEADMSRTGWALCVDGPGSSPQLSWPATVVGPAADPEFLNHDWHEPVEKTIGYFGAVHCELDVPLYCAAAELLPVEFVGPVQDVAVAATLRAAGVRIRPAVPIGELPDVVDRWAAVTLFYRGARASTIVPAKLWNCVASRRPVLVSGLSVAGDARPSVTAVRDPDDILAAVHERPRLAAVPTWGDRWRELLAVGARRR